MDKNFLTRHKNKLVAYVDESFSAPSDNFNETFYILTAYLLPTEDIPQVEKELEELLGKKWHTTQAAQSNDGRNKINAFTEWVSAIPKSEHLILTYKSEIHETDSSGEKAREESIIRLLDAIAILGEKLNKTIFVALEERKKPEWKRRDNYTIKLWKEQSENSHLLEATFTSPTVHRALWVPDLVCYTHRPNIKDLRPEWHHKLQSVVDIIDITN